MNEHIACETDSNSSQRKYQMSAEEKYSLSQLKNS